MVTDKSKKNLFILGWGMLAFLIFIAVTNPPGREVMITFSLLLGFSLFALSNFKKSNNLGLKFGIIPIILGIVFGVGFILISAFVPGFSIALPLLPQTIGETLRSGIILYVAPIVEEFAYLVALLAILTKFKFSDTSKMFLISMAFSLSHLSAYIFGIYDYTTLTQGLSAFYSNLAVFSSAFIYRFLTVFLVLRGDKVPILRSKVTNILFFITMHSVINHIVLFNLFSKLFTVTVVG